MNETNTTEVAVIGGGVVGAAITFHLAHSGVRVALYERESSFALAASGTNSGCLHTGFDSVPGELETDLILRSSELRPKVLEKLSIPVLKCGAVLNPRSAEDYDTISRLADNATTNGVEVSVREDGSLVIPGEWVTDPVAYTHALLSSAVAAGAEVRSNAAVSAISHSRAGFTLSLEDGGHARAAFVVNAAGLFADEVARMIGDDSFRIYPRKGEFLVFDRPDGLELDEIVLPVPTQRTKGVLVFPTVDGRIIAGPTAVDMSDKSDWSVRPVSSGEIMDKVGVQVPALQDAVPTAQYSGLRPAGVKSNYLIEPSSRNSAFINVAAIRSTGLSASLGIGEYVTRLLDEQGLDTADFELSATHHNGLGNMTENGIDTAGGPWWARSAHYFN